MLSTLRRRATRPAIRFTVLLGALVAVASCSDSTDPDLGEPEPVGGRFVFTVPPSGEQRIRTATDVNGDYSVNLPITFNLGSAAVHAFWLKTSSVGTGTEDDVRAVAGKYRLKVEVPAGSGIIITQNETNLMGSVIRIDEAVTDVPAQFSLVRTSDNHTMWGPVTIKITAP